MTTEAWQEKLEKQWQQPAADPTQPPATAPPVDSGAIPADAEEGFKSLRSGKTEKLMTWVVVGAGALIMIAQIVGNAMDKELIDMEVMAIYGIIAGKGAILTGARTSSKNKLAAALGTLLKR